MPVWGQYVLGAAAIVTAIGVLWAKVVRPGARVITAAEEAAPVLRSLVKAFADQPTALSVLGEIAAQFHTNSGSSLRDAIDRITEMAEEAQRISEELVRQREVDRALDERDREQLSVLIRELDRVKDRLDAGLATIQATADSVAVTADAVAADLARAQTAVEGVAADLAESHRRADDVSGPHGAAADAAAQMTKKEQEEQP